jgi:pimeloyl-ACP methyl ester carboxylesterase
MAYANNAGVRVHYEVEGSGPPLVLQHGFTGSLGNWRTYGYVDALRTGYRLILIDARGHGRSDKPHDEASYALDRRVADVTSVLDALGVDRAHYWGYSMGGWMGFGMAKFAPARVNRLIIGGAHPYANPGGGAFYELIKDGVSHGCDALIAGLEKMTGQPLPDADAKDIREADLEAWLTMAGQARENMENILAGMTMPCCIYAGDADDRFADAKLASTRIANAHFFVLPGLDHIQAYEASSKALPRVMEFLGAAA